MHCLDPGWVIIVTKVFMCGSLCASIRHSLTFISEQTDAQRGGLHVPTHQEISSDSCKNPALCWNMCRQTFLAIRKMGALEFLFMCWLIRFEFYLFACLIFYLREAHAEQDPG